jgi:hypothetical protein
MNEDIKPDLPASTSSNLPSNPENETFTIADLDQLERDTIYIFQRYIENHLQRSLDDFNNLLTLLERLQLHVTQSQENLSENKKTFVSSLSPEEFELLNQHHPSEITDAKALKALCNYLLSTMNHVVPIIDLQKNNFSSDGFIKYFEEIYTYFNMLLFELDKEIFTNDIEYIPANYEAISNQLELLKTFVIAFKEKTLELKELFEKLMVNIEKTIEDINPIHKRRDRIRKKLSL